MPKDSKKLENYDESGFEFSKELLDDMATAAINFDRLQKHPVHGYIIFEYLLCEEEQSVTPYTSHPNRYWHKNKRKFLALWRVRNDLHAKLYLVNYAKKGTKHEDEVLLIEVQDMDECGITRQTLTEYTREGFREWFREMNGESLGGEEELYIEIYRQKTLDELGRICFPRGKHEGETIAAVYTYDRRYLEYHKDTRYPYSQAVKVYLEKREGTYGD